MPAITVRNLSEKTHRAHKARAAAHGRSTEAEVRSILDAVAAGAGPRLGSLLRDIGEDAGGVELEIDRERPGAEPRDLT